MKDRLHILRELAHRYERTQAGRTGRGERDLLLDYEGFLREAGCADGAERHLAERELAGTAREGVLILVPHRRDPKLIQQIRFSRKREGALFKRIGEPSPTERRRALAQQFHAAARWAVSQQWQAGWVKFCAHFEAAAQIGESVAPFDRDSPDINNELLTLTPKLLAWQGESLLRFTSCVLCGNSKRLEALSSKLGQILEKITDGGVCSLEDLEILSNPRFVLLHGPIKLLLNGQWLDLGALAGPFRLSETDIRHAQEIQTVARRCLTVENETTFHELAKLRSGELLVQTSFPGSATVAFLQRLPDTIEFWHFGDTDVEGYEILRDLRERTGRPFRSLHMRYRALPAGPLLNAEMRRKIERLLASPTMFDERRELELILAAGNKGSFEQESLGRPSPSWPFYKQ